MTAPYGAVPIGDWTMAERRVASTSTGPAGPATSLIVSFGEESIQPVMIGGYTRIAEPLKYSWFGTKAVRIHTFKATEEYMQLDLAQRRMTDSNTMRNQY